MARQGIFIKGENMKRLVVISDLHSGHLVGLTPEKYQTTKQQRLIYDFYRKELEKLQPIDVLVCNGDLIDGDGEKSGGTELITTSVKMQCKIAAECVNIAKAKSVYIIYGTPYHTGKKEDNEDFLEDMVVNFKKAGGHEFIDINGTVFDFKHKVSGSVIPHGRHTAVSREKVWNLFWNEIGGQPKSDVFIRSHVHYYDFCGNTTYLSVITPGLQGYGSKYGVRACSGVVDIGFVHFDIEDDGGYNITPHIFQGIAEIAPKVIKI